MPRDAERPQWGFQATDPGVRFAQSQRLTESGCWEWSGMTSRSGYGMFYDGTKTRRAHIVSYEMAVGQVPDGLELDHLCRNRKCVNPAHLEPVTHQENVRRAMWRHETCPNGHPWSTNAVWHDGGRRRRCRLCQRAYNQAYRARKAVAA